MPRAPASSVLGHAVLHAPGVGEVTLAWSAAGLTELTLPLGTPSAATLAAPRLDAPPPEFALPLARYFAGEWVEPAALPVDLRGTPFQMRVWEALRTIPRGEVRSYAAIAAQVGSPRGMRAVGMANARNPIAIVVPCHRVVESGLSLGGYSGGLDVKRHLLGLEGVRVAGAGVHPGQLELESSPGTLLAAGS